MFRFSFVAMSLRLRRRTSGAVGQCVHDDHARTAAQGRLGKTPDASGVVTPGSRHAGACASALSCGHARKTRGGPPMAAERARRGRGAVAAALLAAWPMPGRAQGAPADAPARLAPVVVTATRTEEPPFDVPASIDRIGGDAHPRRRARRSTSPRASAACPACSRATARTTRRTCRSRCAASARARPSASAACASTSTASRRRCPTARARSRNVDLGSAERIEVLRGPFSALYGNSSGGVIQVFTEEGSGPPTRRRRRRRRQLRRAALRRQGERRASAAFGYVVSAQPLPRPTATASTARPSATSATPSSPGTTTPTQADAGRQQRRACRRRRTRSA